MGHDRRRRRRIRRLDGVAPATRRRARAAARCVGPGACACLIGRRIAHHAHRVWPRRDLHAHGVGVARALALALGAARACRFFIRSACCSFSSGSSPMSRRRSRFIAARPADRSARPGRAREALPASRLGRYRDRLYEPRARRADGSARRADAGGASSCSAGGEYRLASVSATAMRRRNCTSSPPPTAQSLHCRASSYSRAGPGCRSSSRTFSARASSRRDRKCSSLHPRRAISGSRPGTLPVGRISTTATSSTACPDLEARGFKIAHDKHGPAHRSRTSGDRVRPPEGLADVRDYMQRRFPALASASARRVTRLPVREQLQWRPADRPASRLEQRLAGRRGIRPRVQAWTRCRSPGRGPGHGRGEHRRTAFHAGEQGEGAGSRGS